MAIPDYQTLMLPVLRLAADSETRVPDIAEQIANDLGLSEQERNALLESGRQPILQNRVHWAKLYMGKAGLLSSERRGWFKATETGLNLLATQPDKIDVKRLLEYPSFVSFYRRNQKGSDNTSEGFETKIAIPEVVTPEDQIDRISYSLRQNLAEDLIQRIWQNSPSFFETLIIELLLAMGYGGSRRDAAEHLGRSGDGGVDGIIREDILGLDRIYIQAKRYNPDVSIGRPEIQGFVGSLVGRGATKGVFVTTATFSRHAMEYVEHLQQRIVLIDGGRLTSLMMEHDIGVRISRTINIKRLDEDFFSEG